MSEKVVDHLVYVHKCVLINHLSPTILSSTTSFRCNLSEIFKMLKPSLAPYTVGVNYESPATWNYIFRPLYGYGSAYGIFTGIDGLAVGLGPEIILESCHEIQSRLDKRLNDVSCMSKKLGCSADCHKDPGLITFVNISLLFA